MNFLSKQGYLLKIFWAFPALISTGTAYVLQRVFCWPFCWLLIAAGGEDIDRIWLLIC